MTINPATLTYTADAASRTYGAVNPSLTGSVSGFVSGDTLSNATTGSAGFNTAATTGSNVGSYAVNGSGLTANHGNYTFTQAAGNASALTINPATLTYTADAASRTYGAVTPSLTGSVSGFVLEDTLSNATTGSAGFNTAATTGSNVGSYAVNGSGLTANYGNYTFTQAAGNASALTINPATLTYTADPTNRTYGAVNPSLTGSVSGFVSEDTLSNATTGSPGFTTAATTGSNVGTYAVNGSGLTANHGNYTFTQAAGNVSALTINPARLDTSVSATDKSYDGTTAAVGALGALQGIVGNDDVVLNSANSTYAFANKNAGTWPVLETGAILTGAAAGNYTLDVHNGRATIQPATLVYTANNANRTYGAPDPALSGTVTGFVAGEDLNSATTGAPTFSPSATQWSDVGQYGILGSGLTANQGNYTFAQAAGNNSALRITPASVTATVLASDKMYDGTTNAAGSLQLNGVLNNDNVLATGATYEFSDKNAGTGKTVSEAGGALSGAKAVDYVLTSVTPGAASITPAPLTATYTANNKMYDATTAAAGTLGALSGVLGQDNAALAGTASYTFTDPNAGVGKAVGASGLSLTGADARNYTLTLVQNGSTTISAAPLLYVASTGNTRPYGSPNPSVSGVVTGLQGSDTLTATTTGSLAFSSPAVPSSNVGSYAVDGSGLSLATGNYTLSQAPGNANALSVTPIVISIGSVMRAASQPNPTFRASYSGPASDYVQSVLSNLALVTNAPIGNNPGTYQITAVVPPEIATDLIIQPGVLTITNDALPASMQTQSAQTQAASLPAPVAAAPSTSAAIAPANATGSFQIVIAPSQNWVSPAAPSSTNSAAALSVASFTEPEPAANGSNTDHRNTYAAGARK